MRTGSIFILELLGDQMGGRKQDCWRQAEKGIEAGYMIEIEGQQDSLLGFQGRYKRETVEQCAESAFPSGELFHAKIVRNGDVTRFETEGAGTAVVWWRSDSWVFVGTADQIALAKASDGSLSTNSCLKELLPALPDEPIAVVRCDAFFENILGVPTTGWTLGMSMTPETAIDGSVTVQYSSTAEAAMAMQTMTSKSFPSTIPKPILDFIGSLPATADQSRIRIDLHLTKEDFEKIDMAALQQLTEELEHQADVGPKPDAKSERAKLESLVEAVCECKDVGCAELALEALKKAWPPAEGETPDVPYLRYFSKSQRCIAALKSKAAGQ